MAADHLANHLYTLRYPDERGLCDHQAVTMAARVRANPQAHIDALVEAGVLRPEEHTALSGPYLHYAVVQPHVHEWRVVGFDASTDELFLRCESIICPREHKVHRIPNRLPIEVPNELA